MKIVRYRHPAFFLIPLIFAGFLSGCGKISASLPEEPVITTQGLQSTEKVRFSLQSFPPENPEYEYDLRFDRLHHIQTSEVTCPPTDQVAQIKAFFQTNRICFIDSEAPPNAFCTQAVRFAYATLISPSDEIPLGYQAHGCDDSVDLCEGRRAEFVELLEDLVASAKAELCL